MTGEARILKLPAAPAAPKIIAPNGRPAVPVSVLVHASHDGRSDCQPKIATVPASPSSRIALYVRGDSVGPYRNTRARAMPRINCGKDSGGKYIAKSCRESEAARKMEKIAARTYAVITTRASAKSRKFLRDTRTTEDARSGNSA